MPKMISTLIDIKLDVAGATRALEQEFHDILFEGTKAWVREVASIVPNWSGMSRASLKPIADLVDLPLFAGPVAGAPNRVQSGLASGFAELRIKGFSYHFYWESTVFHYVFNEYNNANKYGFHLRNPGPYYSMKKAETAFFNYVNPRLKKLKFNLGQNIKTHRRVVSG